MRHSSAKRDLSKEIGRLNNKYKGGMCMVV